MILLKLAFPALLVGGALAFEQLMAPARVMFGQGVRSPVRSGDATALLTSGWELPASVDWPLLSIPVIFATSSALQSGVAMAIPDGRSVSAVCSPSTGWRISAASTPYLALVIDLTDESERPRAVGIIWCMLTIGIIGAIAISSPHGLWTASATRRCSRLLWQTFMNRVALVIGAIVLLATIGIEPASRPPGSR